MSVSRGRFSTVPSRRRLLAALVLALTSMIAAVPGASAHEMVADQGQDIVTEMQCAQPNVNSACYHGLAQTFTAGDTGYLVAVDMYLNRADFTSQDLVVQLRVGGPGGVLSTLSDPIPASLIPVDPDGGWVFVEFANPPIVHPGEMYAIVIPQSPMYTDNAPMWRWGKAGNEYDGGVAYGGYGGSWDVWQDGSDFAFFTYVAVNMDRYGGATRFETAALVSQATFAPGVSTAYVAYAYNFPDALAGAAAAGTNKGPVLLANTTGALNTATKNELNRLHPARIIVLGSEGVISRAVFDELKNLPFVHATTRLWGSTRFDTAVAVSQWTFAPGVPIAYVAYAYNFPDALAGAAAAGKVKGPVLLANTSGALNAATKAELIRLHPAKIAVLGSEGVISSAVYTELTNLAFPHTMARYWGSSRFETAAAVSQATFSPDVPTVYIAYAWNFPDALAGAAAAGTANGPVLLVNTHLPLSTATTNELIRLRPQHIVVLGSSGVVGDDVLWELGRYVTAP